MSEIVYCRTCNKGRSVHKLPSGLRTCNVCKGDDLGETIMAACLDPYEANWCDRCFGAVDVGYDTTKGVVCARCRSTTDMRWIASAARDYRIEGRQADVKVLPTIKAAPRDPPEVQSLHAMRVAPPPADPRPYADIAAEVAATVERKNKAYGDSFAKVTRVLELMFPNGIPVEAYADVGGIVRTLDKLFRVATDRDALEENPWGDIAGYALLAVRRVEQDKDRA